MYSLNGIPLDNASFGWTFLEGSSPILAHSVERERLRIPGRDGTVPLPGSTAPSIMRLLVETPGGAPYEALLALASADPVVTLTSNPNRIAATEFLGSSGSADANGEEIIEVELLLNVPGAFWRDLNTTTTAAVNLTTAAVELEVMAGISAPVQDAIIRVKGACTGLQVSDDVGGSYFAYSGTLTGTQWLRFEAATGRAYVTTSDVWTGGTEVSGEIDYDGPRGVFEIMPDLTVGDPADRTGRLNVSTATRSAASVQVRGRGAYRGV